MLWFRGGWLLVFIMSVVGVDFRVFLVDWLMGFVVFNPKRPCDRFDTFLPSLWMFAHLSFRNPSHFSSIFFFLNLLVNCVCVLLRFL